MSVYEAAVNRHVFRLCLRGPGSREFMDMVTGSPGCIDHWATYWVNCRPLKTHLWCFDTPGENDRIVEFNPEQGSYTGAIGGPLIVVTRELDDRNARLLECHLKMFKVTDRVRCCFQLKDFSLSSCMDVLSDMLIHEAAVITSGIAEERKKEERMMC